MGKTRDASTPGCYDADPAALKKEGNTALISGDTAKALCMYTFALDILLKGEAEPSELTNADWFRLDKDSAGRHL